ncbi:RNA polymerase sigma factor [Dichotomicrobium thermohalophilum]|uniref:RNA polymerase sigma-70 factor (ECF subfamily) n=1 Tax=Dichotomicrobium thermohalophilum TaxID=933063 RepID=A0A397QAJ3_9HYPH|nr:sigma-70 family RNA polymerase sigma factor [Dichotomicrobium thermohalophilum]RIA55144.1 RNA polymerase sigma-70 factor (ECF subfamily) [Dichotomicrobium thermohalophilum]
MDETNGLIASEIPRLQRYAQSLARDGEAAEDLVQDTLERAIRKQHLWARRGPIRTWLYRVLLSVFLNKCATNARRQPDLGLEDGPQLWQRPSQEDRAHCREVAQAMQRLPHDQRAAIALIAVEGLDYKDAAAILDIPLGTLRSRLSRGRHALRAMCPDHDDRPQAATEKPVSH